MVAIYLDTGGRGQADKRITPEALPALHRLQQIGKRPVGKLEINGERRVEIGKGLQHHWDTVVALRRKCLEFGFGHDSTPENGNKKEYGSVASGMPSTGSPAPVAAGPERVS